MRARIISLTGEVDLDKTRKERKGVVDLIRRLKFKAKLRAFGVSQYRREYRRVWREKNRDKIRAYDRIYSKLPYRREYLTAKQRQR